MDYSYVTPEPQKTGWPLTQEERVYVLKQEHERRPGSEANNMFFTPALRTLGGRYADAMHALTSTTAMHPEHQTDPDALAARLLSLTPDTAKQLDKATRQGLIEIAPVHLPPPDAGDCNHYGWPVATMTGDTIVVMHRRIPGHKAAGAGRPNPTMSYGILLRSEDGGKTWSEPYDLRDCMTPEDRNRGGLVPLSHRAKFDKGNTSREGYKVHLHSIGTTRDGAVVAINNHGVFRFEIVRSECHRMELWLWSMAAADWEQGQWRRECRLLACKGQFYSTADGFHPAGAVADEQRGVQHIFIYSGHPNGPAGIFRITRTLDTPKLVEVLKARLPNAKLILASSTPVTAKGKPTELEPDINPIIVEHNRMAAEVMKEMKVPVNDFCSLLIDKRELARGDRFHWTAPAYKLLADQAVHFSGEGLRKHASKWAEKVIPWLEDQLEDSAGRCQYNGLYLFQTTTPRMARI